MLELYLMIETGKAGWKVACGLRRGLSAAAAKASYTGMRGGGGHAMRHLMEEGLIANKGSLTLRAAEFQRLTLPILRNPSKTFSWKLGDTPSTGYVGMIGGKNVVVFVAKSGKYAGKVIGSFVPDGKQVVQWGIK